MSFERDLFVIRTDGLDSDSHTHYFKKKNPNASPYAFTGASVKAYTDLARTNEVTNTVVVNGSATASGNSVTWTWSAGLTAGTYYVDVIGTWSSAARKRSMSGRLEVGG